eukprot:TRINITY_DN30042_c0_g2_i1.p1 TRINITY_DN30042_c0_g2~~TRINITY_DN30042_c0_g2_i1.p1  ORF type:complete len:296 (+),score=47.85 TRINITY_DN30042_c0_g2_i1:57-944(+)
MAPLVRLLHAAAWVAAPLTVCIVALYIYCFVRTRRWRKTRVKGKNEEKVKHTAPVELYTTPLTTHVDSQRIQALLNEKNIEFKVHLADHGELGCYENLKDEFLKVNKNAEPVLLVHNGHPIVQVDEIAGYIDEHFPAPYLLPRELRSEGERLAAVRWMQFATPSRSTLGAINKAEKDSLKNHPTLATSVNVLSQPLYYELDNMTRAPTVFCALFKHPNSLGLFFLWLRCLLRFIWPTQQFATPAQAKAAIAGVSAILQEMEAELQDGREYIVGTFNLADIMIATELNRLELLLVI